MLEEIPTIDLPARSRLYGLPIDGTGGSDQEAILDYAQRLSLAHHLRVRDTFAKIILPEAGIQGAFFISGHFSAHAVRGCSGWSGYALAFQSALQRLTARDDVGMGGLAAWGRLLHFSGYAARTRRWCSACLRDQRERGFYTFKLLWAFEAVRVCPLHQTRLAECCGRCDRPQPFIGDLLASGRCNYCGASLAETPSTIATPSLSAVDLYRARAMTGMIDVHRTSPEVISSERLSERLRHVAEAECGGSMARLERQLGLARGSLRSRRRRSLSFLLEVSRRLGVEPHTLLSGASHALPDAAVDSQPYGNRRSASIEERRAIGVKLAKCLREAFEDRTRLTTRLELARSAGVSNSFLQSHYTVEIRALRAHNDAIRPILQREKWEAIRVKIESLIRRLVSEGAQLSTRRISIELEAIGLHRKDPNVRRIATETMQRDFLNTQSDHLSATLKRPPIT